MKNMRSLSLVALTALLSVSAPAQAMEVDAISFNFEQLNASMVQTLQNGKEQAANAAHSFGKSFVTICSKVMGQMHAFGATVSHEFGKAAKGSAQAVKAELPAAVRSARSPLEFIKSGIASMQTTVQEHPYIAGAVAATVIAVPAYFLGKKAVKKQKNK